ncbi:hypothetical protein SAMN04488009_2154 [Maribacter sedimenticola]|uniref:Uncharacterized protein n=1 Tax=Maribacter sedimenticola TaxID=228956 RepID=A0ABY1SH91_9FLAO|nr:hypothetical protein [Maribacter sedimenticola]SNR48786.1 hypothetical protein SAMN04488009_2154 [Maribacter sedimenticola]
MDNTPLEQLYKELISILWESLLFYIPNNVISNEFFKDHKKLDFQKFRNEILIIDQIEGPIVYETGRNSIRTILKGSSLKKNIRQLLHIKSNSNESEFNYVLELYYEQAECLYYITEWLNLNIKQVLPLEDTIRALFKIQYDDHRVHFETIIRLFYPKKQLIPKGNFDMARSMESYFTNLSILKGKTQDHTISPITSNDEGKIMNATPPLEKKPEKKVAKKRPIITESEAETILLKRIFNIDTNLL